MFERRPSKAEIRSRLQSEVEAFLKKGGQIQKVQMGETGLVDGRYPLGRGYIERPKTAATERTPVPELLAAIDSRRSKSRKPSSSRGSQTRRSVKQKTLYDDFGEPVRKVWIEE
ncbi:hypothetical protein ACFVYJ_04205 [Pontibacter sp. JAM-7]|uniref:hypothetical protein n=1 Tax=Pontibacter sp. JAM-7 TaxID=3366581 RepID=UPI003AF982D4